MLWHWDTQLALVCPRPISSFMCSRAPSPCHKSTVTPPKHQRSRQRTWSCSQWRVFSDKSAAKIHQQHESEFHIFVYFYSQSSKSWNSFRSFMPFPHLSAKISHRTIGKNFKRCRRSRLGLLARLGDWEHQQIIDDLTEINSLVLQIRAAAADIGTRDKFTDSTF